MLIFDSQGVVVLSPRVHVELGAVTDKRLKRTRTEQPVQTLCKNRADQELVMKSLLDVWSSASRGFDYFHLLFTVYGMIAFFLY